MFQSLEVFKISQAMANHAATRQSVVAQNMANADTPGYVARDIPDFATALAAAESGQSMRVSRPGHLPGGGGTLDLQPFEKADSPSPNGNSVTLEEEMMKAVSIKQQHDRALAIYKSSLGILRTAIGRS